VILLVEDNPGDVLLLETELANAGNVIPLRIAATTGDAMGVLRERCELGLVIVDIRLAGADGWEVLETIAGDPELARVPAAVLTSSARTDDRTHASALGVESYFIKPLGIVGYGAIVRQLLSMHRVPS
jgi:CheY-like chemotaxis protein